MRPFLSLSEKAGWGGCRFTAWEAPSLAKWSSASVFGRFCALYFHVPHFCEILVIDSVYCA